MGGESGEWLLMGLGFFENVLEFSSDSCTSLNILQPTGFYSLKGWILWLHEFYLYRKRNLKKQQKLTSGASAQGPLQLTAAEHFPKCILGARHQALLIISHLFVTIALWVFRELGLLTPSQCSFQWFTVPISQFWVKGGTLIWNIIKVFYKVRSFIQTHSCSKMFKESKKLRNGFNLLKVNLLVPRTVC